MDKQIKIEKRDILTREYNIVYEEIVMLEILIAHQKVLDPDEMSALKILGRNLDGSPKSTEKMSRKEFMAIRQDELEAKEVAQDIIKKQMK